jgi:outer membrane protein assembly factor BamB
MRLSRRYAGTFFFFPALLPLAALAADGAVLWHAPLGHIDARGFLHGEKFYIPANTDEKNDETFLFALDAATGKELWRVPQPGKPWGSPVVARDGKTILSNTADGQIGVERDSDKGWAHAVTTDGKTVWQAELPNMALQPSVYIPRLDLFIHTTKDGQITALRVADGTVAWQVDAGDEFQAPATIVFDDGNVALLAALDFKGRLTVLNSATGAVHFTAQSGPESAAQSTSSPIAAGDVMYVADAYGITAYGGLVALARAPQ